MKKYRSKIIIAAVIVAALAGAWFIGGGPELNTVTADMPTAIVTASYQGAEGSAANVGVDNGSTDTPAMGNMAEAAPSASISDSPASGNPTGEIAGPSEAASLPDSIEAPSEITPYLLTTAPAEAQEEASAAESGLESELESTQETPQTEPAPESRPTPVEPQDVTIGDGSFTVYLTIRVDNVLNNMHLLNSEKHELVPADGVIFPLTAVTAFEGESVFNVLQREMRRHRIHMESRFTPVFNSAYIMGINNIYEFDAGPLSGWMYKVNGWFPNFGASRYMLSPGDVIEWHYTLDLGRDLGENWLGGLQQDD